MLHESLDDFYFGTWFNNDTFMFTVVFMVIILFAYQYNKRMKKLLKEIEENLLDSTLNEKTRLLKQPKKIYSMDGPAPVHIFKPVILNV